LLILAVVLILSFIFSNKIYLVIFKDVFNTTILVSLFYFISLVVSGKVNLKAFNTFLVFQMMVFGSLISVLGLMDLLDILSVNPNTSSTVNINTPIESLEIDQNFALIPGFLALFAILYYLQKCNSRSRIFIFNILLTIISLNILLSGSRRGMILYILIIVILVCAKAFSLFWKRGIIRQFNLNYNVFLLTSFLSVFLLCLFFFHSSHEFKTNILKSLGTKNVVTAKSKLLINLYRYNSVVDKNISFSDLGWTIMYDPKDPDSGWGSRIHSIVTVLTGDNVRIVPSGSKGYQMDSTCNGSYYPSVDLCESYTLMVNLNVKESEHIKASVYCFVSDSFDINSASFGVGYVSIENKTVSGNVVSYYDLQKRGKWQKLELDFDCINGSVPVYLSFWKKGVKDFSKLNGHIIFAYPTYKKIKPLANLVSVLESQDCELRLADSDRAGLFDIINTSKLKNSSFNPFEFMGSINGSVRFDSDPVRNLVSKFISEDTTYYPNKHQIVSGIPGSFLGDRLVRWNFALAIYTREYTWKQKIFGGGFNFLNWYGYYFLKDKTASDWPHNPFLSILLYSGIVGLLLYCLFLYKVFYYYIKYIKEYPLLFIFFLITFFFSFFSSGSPFDPPVFGFFSILPFFIHSVHQRDKGKIENDNTLASKP
jgi:hypothetical protein